MSNGFLIMSCAAVLMLSMSGNASAANPTEGTSDKGPAKARKEVVAEYRATDLMDLRVRNPQNEELGIISELLVDKQGRISHVVLQAGGLLGMGEHRYAIPWDRVKFGKNRQEAVVDVAKERLGTEFSAFEPKEEEDSS